MCIYAVQVALLDVCQSQPMLSFNAAPLVKNKKGFSAFYLLVMSFNVSHKPSPAPMMMNNVVWACRIQQPNAGSTRLKSKVWLGFVAECQRPEAANRSTGVMCI